MRSQVIFLEIKVYMMGKHNTRVEDDLFFHFLIMYNENK
jgi:hypothetical protein